MVSRWLAGLLPQLNSNPNAHECELGGVGAMRLFADGLRLDDARANGLIIDGAMARGGGAQHLLGDDTAQGLVSRANRIEQGFDDGTGKPDIPNALLSSSHFNTDPYGHKRRGHSHPQGPHT